MVWVFANSRSKNAERLVMLAVADACNKPDGTGAWMSNAALCAKTLLSERAVQTAVKGCERLGELKVERQVGRGGVNRFVVIMAPSKVTGNPAESAPFTETPQNLHPAESAGVRTDEVPQAKTPNPAESAGIPEQRNPAESAPGTVKNSSTKSSTSKTKREKRDHEPREDVDRICNYLAEWIVRNGSKRPTITQRWRTEARLLIDKDGKSLEEIQQVIRWCQRDSFWKANILSMPTLREKFDRLRLASERNEQGRRNGYLGSNTHVPYLDPEDQSVYDRPL
jgi:hypothetical protein